MTWKKNLIIILMILVLFVTACAPADVEDVISEDNEDSIIDKKPVEGGQLTIPLTNFNTLNPLLTTNLNYHYFSKLIFESLFDFEDDLSVVPKLAKDYSIYNEGRTIAVELRNNIRWHDGSKLTSEDVAFTIDVIKYANDQSVYGEMLGNSLGINGETNFSRVIDTNIIDEKKIEIHFDNIYQNNLELLTFPIISKHAFSQSNNRNSIINALQVEDYTPIGTGPYKFEIYEKHKFINLTKNDDYWNGSPNIEEISGRILDSDESILVAFETGQVNFASTIDIDWDKYKQNNRIKVLEYISPSYEFIGFNFNNELFAGENGQAIRKAISYGINRQDIIHKVYLGHATQIDVPIHPDSYLLSDGAYVYGYNKEMALQILNNAGFKDMDDDGVLEDEEGNKLSLSLITNVNNQSRILVSELIKSHLNDIGIEVILDFDRQYVKEYDEIEDESLWEEFNTRVSKGDYDMVLLGWQSSVIPNLSSMYHSSMISKGTNFINYNNEKMDQLLVDTLIGKPRGEKINLYERLQMHIVDELPYLSLYYLNKGLLVDTKINGNLNPTFFNIYNGIETCYIME